MVDRIRVLPSNQDQGRALWPCDWYHEIKYDGFRLRVERNADQVRLITRGGYDWTKRFPWIVEAAQHFVIDGEAVILGVDGYSDFNALHSGKYSEEVQLCAFDGIDQIVRSRKKQNRK